VLFSPGRGKGSRFGLVVSRKVGNAVKRNRVKRWLREAIRHHRAELPGPWDLAIIASPRATTAGYATLERELREVISRVGERRR
jgi:ribonuclease P protein component